MRAIVLLGGLLVVGLAAGETRAPQRFVSCGVTAMLDGALLNCSHLASDHPAKLCNFSWSLLQPGNVPPVVSGSFLLSSGIDDVHVYQGAADVAALAVPIGLCQDQN